MRPTHGISPRGLPRARPKAFLLSLVLLFRLLMANMVVLLSQLLVVNMVVSKFLCDGDAFAAIGLRRFRRPLVMIILGMIFFSSSSQARWRPHARRPARRLMSHSPACGTALQHGRLCDHV